MGILENTGRMKRKYIAHFTEEDRIEDYQNRRAQTEWEAEELIRQHRYEEARELLDMLAMPDEIGTMDRMAGEGIRPVLHNGKVTGWELDGDTVLETGMEDSKAWGRLVDAVQDILNAWEEESQAEDMAGHIRKVLEEIIDIRKKEIRMKKYSKWAKDNEKPYPETVSGKAGIKENQ